MLCLSAAWNSTSTEGRLALPHGRTLDFDTAVDIGLGDLMQRLLNLVQMLRVIHVDKHEVALLKAVESSRARAIDSLIKEIATLADSLPEDGSKKND